MSKKRQEQLSVQLADMEAREVLAAAIDDVPGFSAPGEIAVPERRLLIGLASLAIGDSIFTRKLLTYLKGDDHLLLSARHFLWTGEDMTLRAQLPKIAEVLPSVTPFVEMHELAIALESIGAGAEAADVRARAAGAQRRITTDWESADCNVLPAGNAADTVLTFMHGMLGAAPDAPRGRLRLRVRLPDWLDALTVHNLRLADALITLRYRREATTVRYRIEQDAGAMPVRLIFEPTFTRRVDQVHIDGVAAELALQPLADRVVAPVQLMLDHERELEFELK